MNTGKKQMISLERLSYDQEEVIGKKEEKKLEIRTKVDNMNC